VRLAIGCVAENTPKYLEQALRLVQSVRWFGGALNEAQFYVCVVDDVSLHYRMELERYGVTICVVSRFSTKHPQSNKLRFLELPDIVHYDHVLLLDCDTIVVRDPSSYLFHPGLAAKIADVPTVAMDTFHRVRPINSALCRVSSQSRILTLESWHFLGRRWTLSCRDGLSSTNS